MSVFAKGFLWAAAIVLTASCLYADTTHVTGGQVFGTWNVSGSPYIIGGNITIPPDSLLTIEAGVTVVFDSVYQMLVDSAATLIVMGTASDSVMFINNEALIRRWRGLKFRKSNSASELSYALVRKSVESGITLDYSDVTIRHSSIEYNDNPATFKAGGIQCNNSNAVIEDNDFIQNTGTEGGAIYCISSDIILRNNRFEYNMAINGGALYIDEGDVTILENVFYHNQASNSGGAVFLNDVLSNTFSFNILWHNEAEVKGAGLALGHACQINVYHNTIVGNRSNAVAGGVLFDYNTTSAFTNNIVWANRADLSNSTLRIDHGSTPVITYCDMDSSITGTGNINTYPLFIDSASGDYNLTQYSLCIDAGDPTLPKDPDSSRADIGAKPYYHPNHLTGDIWGSLSASWNPYYIMGPARVPKDSSLTIGAGVIIYSKSPSYGIAIDTNALLTANGTSTNPVTFTAFDTINGWQGLEFRNANSSSLIEYAKFEFSKSSALELSQSDISIDHCTFRKNSSTGNGGAIKAVLSSPQVSSSTFSYNTGGNGGALYFEGGDPEIRGNLFANNHALKNGGGIFVGVDTSHAALFRNIFWANASDSMGGALFCTTLVTSDFSNNTFYANQASVKGGALNIGGYSAFNFKNGICWGNYSPLSPQIANGVGTTITYSDILGGWSGTGNINSDPAFINPSAGDFNLHSYSPCVDVGDPSSLKDPDSTRTDMGASYFNQGRIQLCGDVWGTLYSDSSPYRVNCDIKVPKDSVLNIQSGTVLNFTGDYHMLIDTGAVLNCLGSSLNKIRFTVFDTSDRWGGVIFQKADPSKIKYAVLEKAQSTAVKIFGSSVQIDSSTFQYNTDLAGGPGAIECDSSNSIINANTFNDNRQGAIKVVGGSPRIQNNWFQHNLTNAKGGALLFSSGASGMVDLNVFWNNQADFLGGAIAVEGSGASLDIVNNTLYINQASTKGGGISLDNSSPDITNNIFWSDYAPSNSEIDTNNASNPSVTYCDISGGYTGTGNINQDPKFEDSGQGDFHLQPSSPCIDAGDPAMPPDPDGSRIDMGAFYSTRGSIYNYAPGDMNGDDIVIGGDITYGVRYLKGIGNPPPDSCFLDLIADWIYCAADANGDCQFRGSDITFLVGYFKGLNPQIRYCSQTPPAIPMKFYLEQQLRLIAPSRKD